MISVSKFSLRLKKLRDERKNKNKKWTQKYVADLIGVARVTYTAYENGTKVPPLDTINKIAMVFNVDTDYLMGRTDYPLKTDMTTQEDDEDYRTLNRYGRKLTPEQRKKAIKILEATFEELFDDEED
ncbi:helix-turn-helix domain-containing protein [Lederbergia citrea]|uniref:helix-turn-helix domain-containing protein n=1 Tax=Lederbergia citrea TaxID=2833581 RepID=UPI003211B5F5